ncbi:MAG: molecular chaperone DnaJ, partial [Thaumarchaeota archaeon]|nr:molecular chaperone DnaJ [Nitrososphaerota archaeon]
SRIRVRPDGPGADQEIYLIVSIRQHERFERRGNDLYTQASIPLVDAILGGEVEVPTITENFWVG